MEATESPRGNSLKGVEPVGRCPPYIHTTRQGGIINLLNTKQHIKLISKVFATFDAKNYVCSLLKVIIHLNTCIVL